MPSITRCIEDASNGTFDVIIVGGGIQGAMLMLESSKVGLRPLLLEGSDFGGNTSFNNLRIVHGGLRYLQTMHLSRFRESVAERRWLLSTFPELVFPLPCLMPLYGQLTKNRWTLGAALALNDALSRKRNASMPDSHRLPDGKMLSVGETVERFPLVRREGLKGGALWYDAVMPDCHRIVIETLRWSVAAGGSALNYAKVDGLVREGGKVIGVTATDELAGSELTFRAPIVINAAGPDCRSLARRFGHDVPDLYKPSLAWNILLDREPLSDGAVAIQPPDPKSRVYFAHSHAGRLLLGTAHQPLADSRPPDVSPESMAKMIADVNSAVPGIELVDEDVIHVFLGQLPVKTRGTARLLDEPVVIDHARQGGPSGLYSVSGVKFTTARRTAESVVSALMSGKRGAPGATTAFPARPEPNPYRLGADRLSGADRKRAIERMMASESPCFIEDLLFRRADLAMSPEAAEVLGEQLEIPLPLKDGSARNRLRGPQRFDR